MEGELVEERTEELGHVESRAISEKVRKRDHLMMRGSHSCKNMTYDQVEKSQEVQDPEAEASWAVEAWTIIYSQIFFNLICTQYIQQTDLTKESPNICSSQRLIGSPLLSYILQTSDGIPSGHVLC